MRCISFVLIQSFADAKIHLKRNAMKRILIFLSTFCLSMFVFGQYDDIYYTEPVSTSSKSEKTVTVKTTSSRDIDEYNRRNASSDTSKNTIVVSDDEDFQYTQEIVKFYNPEAVTINDPQYVYIIQQEEEEEEYYTPDIDIHFSLGWGWYSPWYSWNIWDPWYYPYSYWSIYNPWYPTPYYPYYPGYGPHYPGYGPHYPGHGPHHPPHHPDPHHRPYNNNDRHYHSSSGNKPSGERRYDSQHTSSSNRSYSSGGSNRSYNSSSSSSNRSYNSGSSSNRSYKNSSSTSNRSYDNSSSNNRSSNRSYNSNSGSTQRNSSNINRSYNNNSRSFNSGSTRSNINRSAPAGGSMRSGGHMRR